jgi:hypothetical protein
MNHSKSYWQLAEAGNPRHIIDKKLGGCYTPDRRWAGFSESDVGEPPKNSVTLSRQSRDQGLKNRYRNEFGMTDNKCDGPMDIEFDVGRILDELVSSELKTTRLTDDDVRTNICLTMDSTRFQLYQN